MINFKFSLVFNATSIHHKYDAFCNQHFKFNSKPIVIVYSKLIKYTTQYLGDLVFKLFERPRSIPILLYSCVCCTLAFNQLNNNNDVN